MSELDFNQNFISSNSTNEEKQEDGNEDENTSVQPQPELKLQDNPNQDDLNQDNLIQDEEKELRPISPPFLVIFKRSDSSEEKRTLNDPYDRCNISVNDNRQIPPTLSEEEQQQPKDQSQEYAESDNVSIPFRLVFGRSNSSSDNSDDPLSNGNDEEKSPTQQSQLQPTETMQQDESSQISPPFLWIPYQPDADFPLHDWRINRNNRKKSSKNCSDGLTVEQLKSARQDHDYTSSWEGFRVLNYRANVEKSSTPISNDEEIFGPNGFDMIYWLEGSSNDGAIQSEPLDLSGVACEIDYRTPSPANDIDDEKVDSGPETEQVETNSRKKLRSKESVANYPSQAESNMPPNIEWPQDPDSNAIVMKFFKQIGPNTCAEVKRVEYRVNENCTTKRLNLIDDNDETGTIITTAFDKNIVEKRSVLDDLTLRSIQSGAIIPTYHEFPKKYKKFFNENNSGTTRMKIPSSNGEAEFMTRSDRDSLGQSPSTLDSSPEENSVSDSDDSSCQFTGVTRTNLVNQFNLRYFLIRNFCPSFIMNPKLPLLDLWTKSKEKRRMIQSITQDIVILDPIDSEVDQDEDENSFDENDNDNNNNDDDRNSIDLDKILQTYNDEDYESIVECSSIDSSEESASDLDSAHSQPLGLARACRKTAPTVFTGIKDKMVRKNIFATRKHASPSPDEDDQDEDEDEEDEDEEDEDEDDQDEDDQDEDDQDEDDEDEDEDKDEDEDENDDDDDDEDDEDSEGPSEIEMDRLKNSQIKKTAASNQPKVFNKNDKLKNQVQDSNSSSVVTIPAKNSKKIVKIKNHAATQPVANASPYTQLEVLDPSSTYQLERKIADNKECSTNSNRIVNKNTVRPKDHQASQASTSPVQSKTKLKYPMKKAKRQSASSREDAKRSPVSPCTKRLKTSIRSPIKRKKIEIPDKENNVPNNIAETSSRATMNAIRSPQPPKCKFRKLSHQNLPGTKYLQTLKGKFILPKRCKHRREYLRVHKFSESDEEYIEKFQRFTRLYRLMDYLNQELPLFLTSSLKYVSHFKKEYETIGLMSENGSRRGQDDDYDTDSADTVEQIPNYDDPSYNDIMSTALVLDPLGLDELPGYCGAWIDFYVIRRQSPEACSPEDIPLDSKIHVGTSKIYFGLEENSPTKIYNDRIIIPIKLLFEMDQTDQNGHSNDEYKYYINACVTYHPIPMRTYRKKFQKSKGVKFTKKNRIQFLFGFELENVQDIVYTERLPSRKSFQKHSKDKSGRMCMIKGEETHLLQKFQRFPGSDKKKCKEPRNIVTEFYKWHDIDYDDIFFRENREIEFDFWNAKIRERRMARLQGRVKEETYYVTFRLVRTNLSKQPAAAPPPPTTTAAPVLNNVTNQPRNQPDPNPKPGSFNIGEYLTKKRLVDANEPDGLKATNKHHSTGTSCCSFCDGSSGFRAKNVSRKTRNSMKHLLTNESELQQEQQSSTVPLLPASPLIPRLLHKNDNYQLFFDFVGIQRNLTCESFACPFCYSDFDLIASLILHLELNHDRYKFEIKVDPENLAIRITVELNNKFTPMVSDNMVTRAIASKYKRSQPARRNLSVSTPEPVTTMISYGCDVRSLSNVFYYNREDNQMTVDVNKHMPQKAASGRIFYHSRTMMPVLPTEMDYDSETEEVQWPYQQKRLMIQEFIDVNQGEKFMMIMWNEFMMRNKTRFYALCHLKFAVQAFLKQHLPFILKSNMFNNCLLHVCTLYLGENLSSKDLCDYILYMMKMNVLFQKLTKFRDRHKDIPVENMPEEMKVVFDVFEMNDETPVMQDVPQSPEPIPEPTAEIEEDLQQVYDDIEAKIAKAFDRDFHILGDNNFNKFSIESFNDQVTSLVSILLHFLHSPDGNMPIEEYSPQMDFCSKLTNLEIRSICKKVLEIDWFTNEQKASSDSICTSSGIIDIESDSDSSNETITLDVSDNDQVTVSPTSRTETDLESDLTTSSLYEFNEIQTQQTILANDPILLN